MLHPINFMSSLKIVVTFSLLILNLAKSLDLLSTHWVLTHSKQRNYISGNSISSSMSLYSSRHTVSIMAQTVRDS